MKSQAPRHKWPKPVTQNPATDLNHLVQVLLEKNLEHIAQLEALLAQNQDLHRRLNKAAQMLKRASPNR